LTYGHYTPGETMSSDPNNNPLRELISNGVKQTNNLLARLENSVKNVQQPVAAAVQETNSVLTRLQHQSQHIYARRHEYGPHLVAASFFVVGSVLSLRRGRLAGALGGSTAAGLTYMALFDPIAVDAHGPHWKK